MTAVSTELQNTVELLRSASSDRFIKAIVSLEQRADNAGARAIRDSIRDRMKNVRPPRRLNLMRIFCEPFEEMLRNNVPASTSWIPRAAILPCWRIVEGHVEARRLIAIRSELETMTDADHEQLCSLGAPLWDSASKALAKCTAAARDGDKAALELFDGNETMIGYAETIAAACQVASTIEDLKTTFPDRPFKTLDLAQRETLRIEFQRIVEDAKCDLRCVIHVVAHWTANPAEIFELCKDLDLGVATPLGKILTAQKEKVVVELLGEQMGVLKSNMAASGADLTTSVELARVAVDALGAAIELMKDRKDANASDVAQMQQDLADMVKGRMADAAAAALGSIWSTGDHRDGTAIGRDAIVEAEAAARAMQKCGKLAAKLGVGSAVAKKVQSTLNTVRGEVAEKIGDLEKGGAEEKDMRAAKVTLANATRVLEILEGPERAYEFFKEKRASIPTRS